MKSLKIYIPHIICLLSLVIACLFIPIFGIETIRGCADSIILLYDLFIPVVIFMVLENRYDFSGSYEKVKRYAYMELVLNLIMFVTLMSFARKTVIYGHLNYNFYAVEYFMYSFGVGKFYGKIIFELLAFIIVLLIEASPILDFKFIESESKIKKILMNTSIQGIRIFIISLVFTCLFIPLYSINIYFLRGLLFIFISACLTAAVICFRIFIRDKICKWSLIEKILMGVAFVFSIAGLFIK